MNQNDILDNITLLDFYDKDENINSVKLKPILKWAGGKNKIFKDLKPHFPIELFNGQIKKYYEPFLGGGSIFFNLFPNKYIKTFILSDINEELILFFSVLKQDIFKLINYIENYSQKYSKLSKSDKEKFYYEIRDCYNNERFLVDYSEYNYSYISRAAQMLFLNKTCYNGLYRQNLLGSFNVPFGKNYCPFFFDRTNIIKISHALENVQLLCSDFESICSEISGKDSFVYLDPPYNPISKSSNFTSYHKSNFTLKDQLRLSETYKSLNTTGALLMMNNSFNNDQNNLIFELYEDFKIDYIDTFSTMSSIPSKRKKIKELIITNYQ